MTVVKQFTSIAITQLERCELPPCNLAADFMLSVVVDAQNVLLFNESLLDFFPTQSI
jgi:hypothetical protein